MCKIIAYGNNINIKKVDNFIGGYTITNNRRDIMRNKLNLVLSFILGLIIASSFVYAATIINSKEVLFDNSKNGMNSTNVQSAIDELYVKTKISSSERKTPANAYTVFAKPNYGTTTVTFDFSKLSNYQSLTVGDFITGVKNNLYEYNSSKGYTYGLTTTNSYNQTTGIYTITLKGIDGGMYPKYPGPILVSYLTENEPNSYIVYKTNVAGTTEFDMSNVYKCNEIDSSYFVANILPYEGPSDTSWGITTSTSYNASTCKYTLNTYALDGGYYVSSVGGYNIVAYFFHE